MIKIVKVNIKINGYKYISMHEAIKILGVKSDSAVYYHVYKGKIDVQRNNRTIYLRYADVLKVKRSSKATVTNRNSQTPIYKFDGEEYIPIAHASKLMNNDKTNRQNRDYLTNEIRYNRIKHIKKEKIMFIHKNQLQGLIKSINDTKSFNIDKAIEQIKTLQE